MTDDGWNGQNFKNEHFDNFGFVVAVGTILRLVSCVCYWKISFELFSTFLEKHLRTLIFFSQINVKVWRIWKQFKYFTYWKNAPKAWWKLPKCSCEMGGTYLCVVYFLVFMPCILIICYNILLFGGMVFCTRLPLYTQRKSEYIIKKYFMENRRKH